MSVHSLATARDCIFGNELPWHDLEKCELITKEADAIPAFSYSTRLVLATCIRSEKLENLCPSPFDKIVLTGNTIARYALDLKTYNERKNDTVWRLRDIIAVTIGAASIVSAVALQFFTPIGVAATAASVAMIVYNVCTYYRKRAQDGQQQLLDERKRVAQNALTDFSAFFTNKELATRIITFLEDMLEKSKPETTVNKTFTLALQELERCIDYCAMDITAPDS